MAEYGIEYDSGVRYHSDADTLLAAKREATKGLAYGCGDVCVLEDGQPVYKREFWQVRGRFGWKKWKKIGG